MTDASPQQPPQPPDQAELIRQAVAHLREEFAAVPPTGRAGEVWVERLAMPDGARLHTAIQLPDSPGPHPTIVMRTPYPHLRAMTEAYAEGLTERGFAVVWQACRGTGQSEGDWEPNVNERADGLALLAWLERQDFAQSIGYFGSSYLALTGWAMADAMPAKVKALYLSHYGTDRFTSAYCRGLFRHDVLTAWAMENAGFPVTADYLASCRYRPQVEVDQALWGGRLDWYRQWVSNPNRDDPYWTTGFWAELAAIPSRVTTPVCLVEGWFDHHLGSALQTWQALPEATRRRSRLRIGAWNHTFQPCVTGDDFASNETADALAWFDALLKGGPGAAGQAGRVEYYLVGAGRWQAAARFPLPTAGEAVFYLTAPDGVPAGAVGGLSGAVPTTTGQARFVYDPDDPVPTHGAESCLRSQTAQGSLAQAEPGRRSDVLSFVSAPLVEDLTVAGPIRIELNVSSTAEDTAFAVKLCEVTAGGLTRNLRTTVATLAYRDGQNRPVPYEPGQVVRVQLETWDIAWRLPRGSRLRLDVSSSDFPQYSAHTNTPGVWSLQTKAAPAHQTLHWGGDSPARLILPLAAVQSDKECPR
ncbi:MAG: CocE/NonD family hydrolase [Bifidobacteriaceae bacterium]|jgi:putative CocE/NonD family hydrolase|nr:CocE/NonD family hydrolase [Bifidobacteriaceae bacterium]